MKLKFFLAVLFLTMSSNSRSTSAEASACAISNPNGSVSAFNLQYDRQSEKAHLHGMLQISAGNQFTLRAVKPLTESTIYYMYIIVEDGLPEGVYAPAVMVDAPVEERFTAPPGYHNIHVNVIYHGSKISEIICALNG